MEISILDVPLMIIFGIISAFVYKNFLREKNPDWHIFLAIIFVGIFWVNSLLTHLGFIDPWYFDLYTVSINNCIALFYVLSYPMWFGWSMERMFEWIGRSPEEGGFLWGLKIGEDSESFEPAWKHSKREDLNNSSTENNS